MHSCNGHQKGMYVYNNISSFVLTKQIAVLFEQKITQPTVDHL